MSQDLSDKAKIGFWTLISIVISAQLGASIFLLPTWLAPFRNFGLYGWGIAGIGAILITACFAWLCIKTSKQGGPHIYARMFFGEKVGFFVTWIYWWGAWAGNPIMIATAIDYLMSVTGDLDLFTKLALEISLVISLTLVNTRGVKTSGNIELVLTILKILPLIIIPIVAFPNINIDNFSEPMANNMSGIQALAAATIVSFWGFVGLEGGTSPAEFVRNPRRTIPLAIVVGTAFVALICLINTISIYGIIPPSVLENTTAPFAKIMTVLFGGSYEKIIGIVTFLMCAGSLNAWVLFSGQISSSAAKENIFPKMFNKRNKHNSPSKALWISAAGTIVLLCLQKTPMVGDQIIVLLNMAVIVYVFLYVIAIASFFKFLISNKTKNILPYIIATLALSFCLFIMLKADFSNYILLIVMSLTGIPIWKKMKKNDR